MTYSDKVICYNCDEIFENEKSHNNHHEAEHSNEPYTCQLCNLDFKNRASYYKHKHNNHYKPFGCNSCDFKAAKVDLIKNHIKRSHKPSLKTTKKSKTKTKRHSTRKVQENSENSHIEDVQKTNNTDDKFRTTMDLDIDNANKNERHEKQDIMTKSDIKISTTKPNDDSFDDSYHYDAGSFSDPYDQSENQDKIGSEVIEQVNEDSSSNDNANLESGDDSEQLIDRKNLSDGVKNSLKKIMVDDSFDDSYHHDAGSFSDNNDHSENQDKMGSEVIEQVHEDSVSNDNANLESGDDSEQLIDRKNLSDGTKISLKKLMVDIKPLKESELFISDSKKKIFNERLGWHKAVYKEKVKCVQCDEVFKNEPAHNVHHEEMHPGEPYHCQSCIAVFKDRQHYTKHKWTNHNKPYACDYCNFTTCKLPQITNHIFSKHTHKSKKTSKCKSNSDSKKVHINDSNNLGIKEAEKKNNEIGDLESLDVEVKKSVADDGLKLSVDIGNEKMVGQNQTIDKTDLASIEDRVNEDQTKDILINEEDISTSIVNKNSKENVVTCEEMESVDQANHDDAPSEDLVQYENEQYLDQGRN